MLQKIQFFDKKTPKLSLSELDTDSDADLDEDTPINTRLRFRVPQIDLILY
jgi:hypothetical protein